MSEPVKWLFYDITKKRYVDDDGVEAYIGANPESVLVEVQVDINNPLPSGTGIGLIPEKFPSLIRSDFDLYELCLSGTGGNNIYVVSSGNVVQSGFLPLEGGTMIGDLILDHDPLQNLEAATKQYVDNTLSAVLPISYSGFAESQFVNESGDTMTGFLTLNADPTNNLHAATKQYVDNQVSDEAATRQANDTALSGAIATTSSTLSSEIDSDISTYSGFADGEYVNVSGDSMTGFLTLNADPVNDFHAATKQYVDAKLDLIELNNIQALTVTGILLNTPFADVDFASNEVVQGSGISHSETINPDRFTVNNSGTYEVSYTLVAVSGTVVVGQFIESRVRINDSQIIPQSCIKHSNVLESAHVSHTFTVDLISGNYLTLQAREGTAQANHALEAGCCSFNIRQLDGIVVSDPTTSGEFLPISGGTMGGSLVLANDPTQNLEAATKQYVDIYRQTIQADFTVGTNLLVTNNQLPLNIPTEIQIGTNYTVNANNITISEVGIYEISWQVGALIAGTGAARRRNLAVNLNRNSGTNITSTVDAAYSRDSNSSPAVGVGGSYIIETTTINETVGIRTRDLSNNNNSGITFTLEAGYLKVRRLA